MEVVVAILVYVVSTIVFSVLVGRAIIKAEPELRELRRAVMEFKAIVKKELFK